MEPVPRTCQQGKVFNSDVRFSKNEVRLGRLKYKTSVFFFKTFIDNIQEVCYTKVYEIVLNGGFLHEFLYADPDRDEK